MIVCPSCHAKVRAGRDRCPRCGHRFTGVPPAPRLDLRRVAPYALGTLAVVAVVAAVGMYRRSASDTEPAPATRATAASPARPAPATTPAAPDSGGVGEIPFIEPAAAGAVAYQGGEYERALALYQDAVKRNPNDAEAWSNMGQVLVRLGRNAEAIPTFDRAIAILPGRWAYHFNRARAYGLLNDWPKAVEGYRAAQQLYPDDYAIAFNLGLALRKTGDHAAAVEQFQKAISLDPGEPTFHLSLAMSYESLGRMAEAVEAFRRTLELAPEAPEAPQIRARMERLVQ
jgi:Flp pilus assembly protein TadD